MIATKSILVIGRPQRGKSSILSTLIDGDPSNIMFIKRNGYGTEWVETLLFGTDHPYRFIEAPGFVDGLTKNGLDIKKEWFEQLKKVGNPKVSLVIIAMFAGDKTDNDQTRALLESAVVLFKQIKPNKVVLALTKYEDKGMFLFQQQFMIQDLIEYFGKEIVHPKILPFAILEDQSKQKKLVQQFNLSVINILKNSHSQQSSSSDKDSIKQNKKIIEEVKQTTEETKQSLGTKRMESTTSFKKSIVVIGLAGRGKSSILNTLISGDPNGEVFRAAKSKKAVTTKVDFVDSEIFGMNSPNFICRFFDVPGLLGGEQTFTSWSKDFIKKLGTSKVSLVFLVMSKDDRMDEPAKITWAAVKDLFNAIVPNQVVLTLTRCEDGLDEEEEEQSMQEVNDFFGEGTVQQNILQFKIMKDQAKQRKFVQLFNSEVFDIIGDAPRGVIVDPAPEYKNVIKQYKRIVPEESQKFRDFAKEIQALKQELRAAQASQRPGGGEEGLGTVLGVIGGIFGAASNLITKSTVLVNDTQFKVIIHDHDGTRTLAPGTSQANSLVRGFSIDLEIVNGAEAYKYRNFDYSSQDKVYMSKVFQHQVENWKRKNAGQMYMKYI